MTFTCGSSAGSYCWSPPWVGKGALTLGLKNPDKYASISAFAPISNPINVPWGQKAFKGYLGDDKSQWEQYDATELAQEL